MGDGSAGCIERLESSTGASCAGASSSSSVLSSTGLVSVASSASPISTSIVGVGFGSFAGVSSLCLESGTDSVDISMAVGSSKGGEGGRGEGFVEETSFKAGDLLSNLTDVDRIRSRCSLSS